MRQLPALVIAVVILAGCGGQPRKFVAPPEHGLPEVGVPYRITAWCPEAFQVGDWLWKFRSTGNWPPPIDPNTITMPRDPAPGILTLTSNTQGVFLADSNHTEYRVVRVRQTDGSDWICPGI